MDSDPHVPGPSDALDSGDVAELVRDGAAVSVSGALRSVPTPLRPRSSQHHEILVPEEASALVVDLDAFRA